MSIVSLNRRQAGHGEQIVDAGVRRRPRQVSRARPSVQEPCCADIWTPGWTRYSWMPPNSEMHVLYNPLYTSTTTAVVERRGVARSNNVGWTHGESTKRQPIRGSGSRGRAPGHGVGGFAPWSWNLLGFGAQRRHQICFMLRILHIPYVYPPPPPEKTPDLHQSQEWVVLFRTIGVDMSTPVHPVATPLVEREVYKEY